MGSGGSRIYRFDTDEEFKQFAVNVGKEFERVRDMYTSMRSSHVSDGGSSDFNMGVLIAHKGIAFQAVRDLHKVCPDVGLDKILDKHQDEGGWSSTNSDLYTSPSFSVRLIYDTITRLECAPQYFELEEKVNKAEKRRRRIGPTDITKTHRFDTDEQLEQLVKNRMQIFEKDITDYEHAIENDMPFISMFRVAVEKNVRFAREFKYIYPSAEAALGKYERVIEKHQRRSLSYRSDEDTWHVFVSPFHTVYVQEGEPKESGDQEPKQKRQKSLEK